MTDATLKSFAVELWSVDAEAGKMFDAMIAQINHEAVMDKGARNILKALRWIARRDEKTLMERLSMMHKLGELRVPAIVNMKLFTGWN
jgi:hypothetical protein